MKKAILTIAIIVLMVSCGTNDKEQMYAKATKYLDGKLNTEDEKGFVVFKELDTLVELSEKDMALVKRIPLMKELTKSVKHYKEFKAIDERFDTGEENSETIHYRNIAIKLQDSLSNMEERDDELDSTNIAGYMVSVKAEATEKATGAKFKDLKFEVYFDEDKDVDAVLNSYLYEWK